jgi:hypothetical protein
MDSHIGACGVNLRLADFQMQGQQHAKNRHDYGCSTATDLC